MINDKNRSSFLNRICYVATCVSFSLSACSFFTIEQHRPVLFYNVDFLFSDTNGDSYAMTGLNHLLLHDPSANNELYYYHYREKRLDGEKDSKNLTSYKSITTNSASIIACEHYLDNGFINKIEVFDTSLTQIKEHCLDSGTFIHDAVSTDKNVYLLISCNNNVNNKLLRVNLNTFKEDILIDDASSIQHYADDDVYVFFDDLNIEMYSNKTKLLVGWDSKNNRSYHFTDKYKLYISDQAIFVEHNNFKNKIIFSNQIEQLYHKAFIIDDKLIFSGLHYDPDKKCTTYGSKNSIPCICGLKESYLFVYDLKLNELVSTTEFKAGTYLIDYDLESAKYYYNGGLYIGDRLVRECEKVEVGEPEIFNRFENFREEWDKRHYHLCYNDGEFFGI